jgi:hypothetical protein
MAERQLHCRHAHARIRRFQRHCGYHLSVPNLGLRSARKPDGVSADVQRDDATGRGHRSTAYWSAEKRELLGRGRRADRYIERECEFFHPDDRAAAADGAEDFAQSELQLAKLAAGFGVQLAARGRRGLWIRLEDAVRFHHNLLRRRVVAKRGSLRFHRRHRRAVPVDRE